MATKILFFWNVMKKNTRKKQELKNPIRFGMGWGSQDL